MPESDMQVSKAWVGHCRIDWESLKAIFWVGGLNKLWPLLVHKTIAFDAIYYDWTLFVWHQPCLCGSPSIIKSLCVLYVQRTQQWIESQYCPRSGDCHITQKLRNDCKGPIWALHGPAGEKQSTLQVYFSQMKIDLAHATEAFKGR
jgi:hypothetical protein